jgi:hypothetical protein
MSADLAKDLLDSLESNPDQSSSEVDRTLIPEIPANQDVDQADLEASEILANVDQAVPAPAQPSAPSPPPTISVSLKTRADLINEIKRQSAKSGDDVTTLNLGRRRKNSLKRILGERCAAFAEKQSRPQLPPQLENIMPEDLDEREKFCISMLYRFDLTCCALLERGVEASEQYHGLTANGFAKSIDDNETLQHEIKSAWSDILANEENRWVLDYCGPGSRLAMCHLYSLANCVRPAPRKTQQYVKQPPQDDFYRKKIPSAPRGLGTKHNGGRLVDACRRQQEGRKVSPHSFPAPEPRQRLVKTV